MPLLLFLNEQSHPTGDLHPARCNELIRALIRVLRATYRHRNDAILVSATPLRQLMIGEKYSIAAWGNDGDNRDEWIFLKRLKDRAPFSTVLGASLPEVEYLLDDRRVEGLGWAHLLDGLSISFPGECWDQEELSLLRRMLEEDDGGDPVLTESVVMVRHASDEKHVEKHRDWLRRAGFQAPSDGQDLWQRRTELFPNLEFLPRVEGQLRSIDSGNAWFAAIYGRLSELSESIGIWNPDQANEPQWRSKVTPDSLGRKKLCWFTAEGSPQGDLTDGEPDGR